MKSHSMILMSMMPLLVACQKTPEPVAPARPALVMKVGEHQVANQGMVLVGEVKSRYESNIGFRVGGKIIKRYVDTGAPVKKGQIIATIDASDANLGAQAASADVHAAEANLALAKAELDRQRLLYEKKFISKSALDIREAEFKTSAARLQQVKSQAAVSQNQSKYTSLTADMNGVIAQINAEPGQVVEMGQVVAKIIDYAHIEVLVAVPESRMKDIQKDKAVTIKMWVNREKTYQGTIREIAPAANSATRAFDVRVAVRNPDDLIQVGMTAGVSFSPENTQHFAIPSAALTQMNGQNSVWVINPQGIATPRAVTTGQYTENGVEVLSGLQAGEMIAVAGVHTLLKGQRVKPRLAVEGDY
jgi:membrane fusion protein, multidrug efflux system